MRRCDVTSAISYLPEPIRLGDLSERVALGQKPTWHVTTMDALADDNGYDPDVCAALDVLADGALTVEWNLGAGGAFLIERLCAHGEAYAHVIADDERPALGRGLCDGPQICSRVADHGGLCSVPTVKGHGDRIVRYRLAHARDPRKLHDMMDAKRRSVR